MKVIIATDGSAHSQRAVEEFCRLFAETKDLRISVVSTYEVVVPLDTFATTAQFSEARDRALHEHAEDCVAQALDPLKKCFPDAVIRSEIKIDFPERYIIELAAQENADLIVVGSHGRGFLGRLTLGSVSDAIVHQAPCSVLVVRKKD